ncbi:hypothetical protein [Thermoleptolyngbya sp. M55_K2018_002]|uniref:hypothetical protein n=1 Tax=Thermoleptolyngbya sp. M55_K2018_002 TaxID=2747808 RepID=UPI001A05128B|nr:hypothetical protein [Thermoleptolyngbya sp. M55_K2018_002]HIK39715.1 hypothetical protein [Thermoleptolyngbya sp. M55_K2018_002]
MVDFGFWILVGTLSGLADVSKVGLGILDCGGHVVQVVGSLVSSPANKTANKMARSPENA